MHAWKIHQIDAASHFVGVLFVVADKVGGLGCDTLNDVVDEGVDDT